MGRTLQLALTILTRDNGSKVLRKALEEAVARTKAAEKAGDDLAKSQQQNSQQGVRASRALSEEFKRANSARSTLGIRSEREIQREIQQTIAAYSRLTRMGVMSSNEQARAFDAMTQRVSKLRTELSSAAQSISRMDRLRNIGSNAMAIAGGAAAMTAVVAQPVRNQMGYERRLAMMANTAYADQDVEGRRAGMSSMDALIRRSVKEGGGTKESAADTLDKFLASGVVDMQSAETLLPQIQKYSTATGANPIDLAQLAISLKDVFGIEDKDMGAALNMAIAAGSAGSFELADMAKWFPQQLASASSLGMRGLDDFSVLLGANQASMKTAGSPDQAGNNLVNLLAKINSQDAANAASRIKINGKGIDLSGTLTAARAKGMNSLDAFNGLVDRVVASDPKYRALEKKLQATTNDGDRKQIIESQKKILEGSAIGKIIADQQALMALLAYRANGDYMKQVRGESNAQRTAEPGQMAGDTSYALIADTNDFKTDQVKNAADFGTMDAVKPLSDVIGRLSGLMTDYANEYPELTTAVSGATVGIKALAAGAAAVAGIRILTGGGGIPGIPGLGGGKSGGFNPTDLITGSSGTAVPVYVTNLKAGGLQGISGTSSELIPDSTSDLVEMIPLIGGAAAAISSMTDEMRESFLQKTMPEKIEALRNGTSGYSALELGWELVKSRVASWSSAPAIIGMPNPDRYGVPEYISSAPTAFSLLNQKADAGIRPAHVVHDDNDDSVWWSKPTSIGTSMSPAAIGLPEWLSPAPVQQNIPPIQANIKVELDGRVIAESVNEFNSQQATRGSNGAYQ
ncbi:phage tail tape measure protein [Pectobacterium versatile]|uniref:phage tail tape measure protein n=1 Tax=Pectobacterium versatile TaxID=2488639 RepID=UPI001969292C|nr:phage tail tape measure protein [Pectobacterium versatile]MBN3237665.1 phage tail tape measure protein [Pectobacterium versatile]